MLIKHGLTVFYKHYIHNKGERKDNQMIISHLKYLLMSLRLDVVVGLAPHYVTG